MKERKKLIDIFLEINTQINLSAIRDAEWVYTKHILDGLELTKIIDLSDVETLCDVGTGWGFPLLVLAQYCQNNKIDLQLTWIDARRKKIDAIADMVTKLWLENTSVLWWRIEEHTQQYDIVTARAVAYADKVIPRCNPLVKKWWILCLYKEVKQEEREEILQQCKKKKLTLEREHKYRLFEGDIERVIYVLRK